MDKSNQPIHPNRRTGVDPIVALLAAAAAFFFGLLVAAALIAWPLEVKREIDLVEIAKVTVLALVAFLLKHGYDKRTRVLEGERSQILSVIDAAWTAASKCHRTFVGAEIKDSAVVTAARNELVRSFAELDSEILLLEKLVIECGFSSAEDTFAKNNEEFNDAILKDGLTRPLLAHPKADETYRELRLSLARTKLRVITK